MVKLARTLQLFMLESSTTVAVGETHWDVAHELEVGVGHESWMVAGWSFGL